MASSFSKKAMGTAKAQPSVQKQEMAAGRPPAFWSALLQADGPLKKCEPQSVSVERLPEKDLKAVCAALKNVHIKSDGLDYKWWLENVWRFHPHDALQISYALIKRLEYVDMPDFIEKINDASGKMDDPKVACKIAGMLIRDKRCVDTACSMLERDIGKYPSEEAAEAIFHGLDGDGKARVAKLICKLPVAHQARPVRKAIKSKDLEVAEIGMALMENQPNREIAAMLRNAMTFRTDMPAMLRLASRMRTLPKKLQVAPMIEAVAHSDPEIAKIGKEFLQGRSRRVWAKAINRAMELQGPEAIPLMGHIAEQPPAVRMQLLKNAIMNTHAGIALEGVRLLGMEGPKIAGKVAGKALGCIVQKEAACKLFGLLGHVKEGKRAALIRNGIDNGGDVGKAAFSCIRLAPKEKRAGLFHYGCVELFLPRGKEPDEREKERVFGILPQREKAAVVLIGIGDEDKNIRHAFASLMGRLDLKGLRLVIPKALRSEDSRVFRHAYDLLRKMGEGEREGMCDLTAGEALSALGKEWMDGVGINTSLARCMENNSERREIEESGENTVAKHRAVLLTPYMREIEREKAAEASCDALGEFLRESRFDISFLGNDYIMLIPFQPEARREGLYELAAKAVARALKPSIIDERRTENGLGILLAESIARLPEKHRPALYELLENEINFSVMESMWSDLHPERLIRALSHLPRETQVKYARRLSYWGNEELMEKLMPGVLRLIRA